MFRLWNLALLSEITGTTRAKRLAQIWRRNQRETNIENIITRLRVIFNDKQYIRRLSSTDKKWIDEDNQVILNRIISFFEDMKERLIHSK